MDTLMRVTRTSWCTSCHIFLLFVALRYIHSFPTRRSSDLMIFLPKNDEYAQAHSKKIIEQSVKGEGLAFLTWREVPVEDRKSTRLNSSHANTSYAVFCLKKKKNEPRIPSTSIMAYSPATSN